MLISNEDMNDIIKIKKSLEDAGVLIDGVTEAIKDEIEKTKRWISGRFFSTFSRFINTTSNSFTCKRYKWKRSKKSRKRIYKYNFLDLFHPLDNIKITNYFNDEPRFNGVFKKQFTYNKKCHKSQ